MFRYTCILYHSLISCVGGKVLRHTEINTDIVTWTRLLTRAAPTIGPHTDATASPMAITQDHAAERSGKKQLTSSYDQSPPSSPLTSTSQSGGSTPKSPITPDTFGRLSPPSYFNQSSDRSNKDVRKDNLKDSSLPMNGELPPPIPLSEEDLISGIHPSGQNEPIIPPPREFLGGSVSSMDDIEQHRRSSAGSLSSPRTSSAIGPPPTYVFPESTWNRTRSPPKSPPGTSQLPPSHRMATSSSVPTGHHHLDPTVGRDGQYILDLFESLGWDDEKVPRQQVGSGLNNSARVVVGGDGGKVVGGGGSGVGGGVDDAIDGGTIASLYHGNHKQQQALHYRNLEHQVCAVRVP